MRKVYPGFTAADSTLAGIYDYGDGVPIDGIDRALQPLL
jgi:hypothetical protein